MSTDAPLDAERILAMLAAHDVDYVIVGGLAVQAHGHVRTTIDIDVSMRPAHRPTTSCASAHWRSTSARSALLSPVATI